MFNNWELLLFCFFHSHYHLDDLVPYDGVPDDEIVTVHIALTVVIVLLATAGVVFAIVCICFNFIFRKRR